VWHALGRPEDLWLAAVGSISDWQLTDIAPAFWERYPTLLEPVQSPPQALFGPYPFAELCRLLQFNLKGDSSDVRTSIKILSRIEDPLEILRHETPRAKLLYKRAQPVQREYERLASIAREKVTDSPVLFVLFPDVEISLISEISNLLLFEYPNKIIFLAREHAGEVKLSLRTGGDYNIAAAIKAAMATGIRGNAGGHKLACGGRIVLEDFPRFKALVLSHLGVVE
jgi:hypothetical protein